MRVKQTITVVIAVAILIGFAVLGINDAVKTKNQLDFKEVQLKSKSVEINKLDLQYEKLNQELEKARADKNTSQEKLDELNKENERLEAEKQKLQSELQAKVNLKKNSQVASATTSRPYERGELKAIVTEAAIKHGLDPEWFWNLAKCESTWNPNAVNKSYYDNGNPSGLFQHISGYWPARAEKHGYAGASVFDPVANANVTASMWKSGSHLWECQ